MLLSFTLLFQGTATVGPTKTVGPTTRTQGSGGGGGGGITFRRSASFDNGVITTTTPIMDLGATVNGAGDLVIVGVTFGSNGIINTVCDSTTNTTCSSSASTYSTTTKNCNGGICTQYAYTCNAAASVRFFTVSITGGANDMTVTLLNASHSVTSSCLDAHPTAITTTAGATLTSNTYSTAVANEIAFSLMSDDNNCGPSWTGSAGTGFTLAAIASACSSMLGAGEYKIYTTTQSSVTSTLTTGNSSGNAVTFDTVTFE